MDIRQAIEKAGEGRRVRREHWKDGVHNYVPHGTNVVYESVCHRSSEFTHDDLTADDWQVVEDKPVIEVGDVVKQSLNGAIVVATCKTNEEACIQWDDGSIGIYPFHKLTLIHKGPREHRFEGRLHKERDGLKIHPLEPHFDAYDSIMGNGKTYRMTLEEAE